MIELGKYYKAKESTLVVKATTDTHYGTFMGEVVIPDECNSIIGEVLDWNASFFSPTENPFKAPQTTQPEPNKDTELRLECLKLAIIGKSNVLTDMVIADAQHYYEWVIKQ